MPDVLAMERVMTHPSLVACLSNLPIRSPKHQQSLWSSQKRLFQRTTALTRSLGGKPSITSLQAKRLDSLGFTFEGLVKLYRECDPAKFQAVLKEKGVNSKPLREKLAKQLKR